MKLKYSNILLAGLGIVLATSLFLMPNVFFSMNNTNTKTKYQYEGSNNEVTISNYYASNTEFVGGARVTLENETEMAYAICEFNDGTIVKHQLTAIDEKNYVLNTRKVSEGEHKPTQITLHTSDDELITTINLQSSLGALYSFTDGHQTYRHVYINDSGIFMGEYEIDTLSDDIKPLVTIEFMHKDENMSGGYHLLAKKQMSITKFTSGEDLGFVPFLETAHFNENKNVYVIINFSDTNVVEIPLKKGVN